MIGLLVFREASSRASQEGLTTTWSPEESQVVVAMHVYHGSNALCSAGPRYPSFEGSPRPQPSWKASLLEPGQFGGPLSLEH